MNVVSDEVDGPRFVLMSFMSPEKVTTSNYGHLYEKLTNEPDLAKRCEMYEILLGLRVNARALKIRGCYATREEAAAQASVLRDKDPYFDIYVGPVGEWMPWDDTNKVEDEHFANEQLHNLMSQYKEQARLSQKEHDERMKTKL
jgi:hypothetical protein